MKHKNIASGVLTRNVLRNVLFTEIYRFYQNIWMEYLPRLTT